WQSWATVPGSIGSVTGKHTVFLKFSTGSGQDFLNLNWITFS
nr:carbohydrate-binding protein [Actinomycetota bacterium]